jgi:hypothetical protein
MPRKPKNKVTKYLNYTLTERPDGKVTLLSDQPGALPVTRNCMKWAIEFIDLWHLTPAEFKAKHGRKP